MFILNKKNSIVQECHNNDAIKACKKDSDNYAVSERREDLVQQCAEDPKKEPEKEETDNSSPDTTKADSGGAESAQNSKKRGRGRAAGSRRKCRRND